jgi:L-2-hydroxyglutarate oxidase LhgO
METCDYLVIGGGIVGLTVVRELNIRFPNAKIILIEKEHDVAQHGSGRNSGVLHAGFYYTADSLKARFTREGNRFMKKFCEDNAIRVNPCGKLVVAKNENDLDGLAELKRRGDHNGVELVWMNSNEVEKIDSNAKTYERALYSPATATVDPSEICQSLKRQVLERGVQVRLGTPFVGHHETAVSTPSGVIEAKFVINCAGLYADYIAKSFGLAKSYAILPFKGTYLSYSGANPIVKTNIYPVPNLQNPFLGIHFTVSVDGKIKMGPAAIPAFWRENYGGWHRFRFGEVVEGLYRQVTLLALNSFGYRELAFSELKKCSKRYFRKQASQLVKNADVSNFGTWTRSGIRAQLLNTQTMELVQDFIIERTKDSIHVLNVVSPGFTCAFPMAQHVVDMVQEARC